MPAGEAGSGSFVPGGACGCEDSTEHGAATILAEPGAMSPMGGAEEETVRAYDRSMKRSICAHYVAGVDGVHPEALAGLICRNSEGGVGAVWLPLSHILYGGRLRGRDSSLSTLVQGALQGQGGLATPFYKVPPNCERHVACCGKRKGVTYLLLSLIQLACLDKGLV